MKVFGSQIHRRREAPRSRCPPAPSRQGAPGNGGHGGPRGTPALRQVTGGSTQPYSCKNREKSVYQRSHMRPETGSCRPYKGSNKKFSAKLEVSRGRGPSASCCSRIPTQGLEGQLHFWLQVKRCIKDFFLFIKQDTKSC